MRQELADVEVWKCPRCLGSLGNERESLVCRVCAGRYPVFGGIADFRINLPAWIDVDADRQKASRLLARAPTISTRDLVADVFRQRPGWSESDVQRRTRGFFDGAAG